MFSVLMLVFANSWNVAFVLNFIKIRREQYLLPHLCQLSVWSHVIIVPKDVQHEEVWFQRKMMLLIPNIFKKYLSYLAKRKKILSLGRCSLTQMNFCCLWCKQVNSEIFEFMVLVVFIDLSTFSSKSFNRPLSKTNKTKRKKIHFLLYVRIKPKFCEFFIITHLL